MTSVGLTADQQDEFRTTGLLRLEGALPRVAAETMCDRLWEFLTSRDGIHRGERSTWVTEKPAGFQPVTRSGAFWAVGGDRLGAALDALFGADRWARRGTLVLTGEPGDVIVMHSDCFHAAAPNRQAEPRMMLTGMIENVLSSSKQS